MIQAVEYAQSSFGKYTVRHEAQSHLGPTLCGRDTKDMRLFGEQVMLSTKLIRPFGCSACARARQVWDQEIERRREAKLRRREVALANLKKAARVRGPVDQLPNEE